VDESIIYYEVNEDVSVDEHRSIYNFEHHFQFTEENGFTEPVDVIFEASVWGVEK